MASVGVEGGRAGVERGGGGGGGARLEAGARGVARGGGGAIASSGVPAAAAVDFGCGGKVRVKVLCRKRYVCVSVGTLDSFCAMLCFSRPFAMRMV